MIPYFVSIGMMRKLTSHGLSEKTERTYRLLSEAEWEYAARAGAGGQNYWHAIHDEQCAHGNGADVSLKPFLSLPTAATCNDEAPFTATYEILHNLTCDTQPVHTLGQKRSNFLSQ